MKLLIGAIFVILSLQAEAQCNVSKKGSSLVVIPEHVYRNANLEDGLVDIYFSIKKDESGWKLIGTLGTTNSSDADTRPSVFAAKLEKSTEPFFLKTDDISVTQEGRVQAVFSVFNLTSQQIAILKNDRIVTIFYINSETAGTHFNLKNQNVLKNQILCIESEM